MRPFSVSAIGTRRFYRSGLPLDDPFGLPPFRRITFQHHFQVMRRSISTAVRHHQNSLQHTTTAQNAVRHCNHNTTHNYNTRRAMMLMLWLRGTSEEHKKVIMKSERGMGDVGFVECRQFNPT